MLRRTTQRFARAAAPLTALLGLGGFLAGAAHAQTATLAVYSTGQSTVYNAGAQAQFANGASDTRWTVNSATSLVTTPNSAWLANNTTSKWISNVLDSTSNTSAAGTHTFETTFVMPSSAVLSTTSISFLFAADNGLTSVSVNGGAAAAGISGGAYNSFSNSMTLNSSNANFTSGTNKLTFVVQNDGTTPNPMGLRVQFTNATVAVTTPEPASLILVALGGLPAIGLVARRRHKKV